MRKTKVAILGSGNIGTDLLVKVLRSPFLECGAFLGRNASSPGMNKGRDLGVVVSGRGIEYLRDNPHCADLVFDATSAEDHLRHAPILRSLGKIAIDLTPAQVGPMCIPVINQKDCLGYANVNMVTCGGQASVPIAYALHQTHSNIDYIEVVSSIAARSAGPATRRNLDEYIHTTERALSTHAKCKRVKAILNLNPAKPCVNMQTTLLAKVAEPNLEAFTDVFQKLVQRIRKYVPGYEVLLPPSIENGRLVVLVRVLGLGDYLPAFAGNLDIINCAAIAMAEEYAKTRAERKGVQDKKESEALACATF